jgi:hypothetical protein
VQFIKVQKNDGFGWAIADFEHFKHLVPKPLSDNVDDDDDDDDDLNMKVDRIQKDLRDESSKADVSE